VRRAAILFIHQSADLYGSDRMLLNILDGLDPGRCERIVILPEDGPLAAALASRGIETHVADVAKIRRSMFTLRGVFTLAARLVASCKAITAAAAGRRVDIVHSNTLAVLGGAVWATTHRVRHVWHVHEILRRPRLLSSLFPWMLWLLADTVVANSHATARSLTSSLRPLARKTRVIPNGVAVPGAPRNPAPAFRKTFNAAEGDVLVTLVGRINGWKGHQVLVRAFADLAPRFPRLRLAMVGSAPSGQPEHREHLVRLVDTLPCKDAITLHEYTEDVAGVWAATDIAVVPSTEPEPFGLVAVEAMASGVPVVAANHGGLAEIVEHGVTGLLVAPGSADALADALARLVESPALREEMGRNGERRATDLFGLARFQAAFAAVYAETARLGE
jgi:glycosyltransferase involved in cell wall biosynthesis